MRYYRTLVSFRGKPAGEIVELSDSDSEQLLKNGAVEEVDAGHLTKRFGASGKLDADLDKAVRQMRETASLVNKQITTLDDKLATLTLARSKLRDGKLRKEDALALVRADIQRKGEVFKSELVNGFLRNRRAPYDWNVARTMEIDTYGHIGIPYLGRELAGGATSQGALFFYFPDQIEAGFSKILDSLAWDDSALSLAETNSQVEAIEREMAELQAQRNALAKQLACISVE